MIPNNFFAAGKLRSYQFASEGLKLEGWKEVVNLVCRKEMQCKRGGEKGKSFSSISFFLLFFFLGGDLLLLDM